VQHVALNLWLKLGIIMDQHDYASVDVCLHDNMTMKIPIKQSGWRSRKIRPSFRKQGWLKTFASRSSLSWNLWPIISLTAHQNLTTWKLNNFLIASTYITSILILKGSRDLNDKKLRNKFLVARANGITT